MWSAGSVVTKHQGFTMECTHARAVRYEQHATRTLSKGWLDVADHRASMSIQQEETKSFCLGVKLHPLLLAFCSLVLFPSPNAAFKIYFFFILVVFGEEAVMVYRLWGFFSPHGANSSWRNGGVICVKCLSPCAAYLARLAVLSPTPFPCSCLQ